MSHDITAQPECVMPSDTGRPFTFLHTLPRPKDTVPPAVEVVCGVTYVHGDDSPNTLPLHWPSPGPVQACHCIGPHQALCRPGIFTSVNARVPVSMPLSHPTESTPVNIP
ncbi:hypothetical protein PoB_005137100 [Plakobranchus ocellatus]|uniref:Uncharacterized protein n=1 Tax=Plakobranchus ocellatus TaxID=259542 RepID=A0AAV4BNN0_9GAST|nr:hypothetical protein PoB_005137100 [Plakobranchus ocellatus]